MEFSASFPVDLSLLAEGPSAAPVQAGPARPQGREFAGLLAGSAEAEAGAADGEPLPPGGEVSPAVAVAALPLSVMPADAVPVPTGSESAAKVATASAAPAALSPLPVAIARALGAGTGIPAGPVVPVEAAPPEPAGAAPALPEASLPAAAPPDDASLVPAFPEGAGQPAEPQLDELALPAPDRATEHVPAEDLDAAVFSGEQDGETDAAAETAEADSAADQLPPRPQQASAAASGRPESAAGAPQPRVDAGGTADQAVTLVVAPAGARPDRAGSLPVETAAESAAGLQQFDLEPGADVDQLATRIRWLADRQIGEARIRLNPPELGALDIRLSVVDDETFVQISAQGAGTRELLEASIPKLRALLGAGGLSLGGASIDSGQHGAGGSGFRFDEPAVAGPPVVTVADERPPVTARRPSGQVDLYA